MCAVTQDAERGGRLAGGWLGILVLQCVTVLDGAAHMVWSRGGVDQLGRYENNRVVTLRGARLLGVTEGGGGGC